MGQGMNFSPVFKACHSVTHERQLHIYITEHDRMSGEMLPTSTSLFTSTHDTSEQ